MQSSTKSRLQALIRRGGTVALSAVLAFGTVPATAFAAQPGQLAPQAIEAQADATSGTLENGLTWLIEGTTLTIAKTGEGSGEMAWPADGNNWGPWLKGMMQYGSDMDETTGITKVVIENGVTSVATSAFNTLTSLREVQIPDSVTTIGASAFRKCESLVSITLPSSVTAIGDSAFSGCKLLKSVELPQRLTALSSGTFQGCEALESIVIPNSVETVKGGTFADCTALASVTLSIKQTSVSSNMFSKCTSLESIAIPASVATIGSSAFAGCSKLANVTFESPATTFDDTAFNGTPYLANMGEVAIVNGRLLRWSKYDAAEVVIPDKVTSIADYAFGMTADASHDEVTQVTIHGNVTSIGAWAFSKCPNLVKVVMQGATAPTLGYGAFGDAREGLEIVVPEGSTGYYATDFPQVGDGKWSYWKTYYDAGVVGTQQELADRKAAREAAREAAADVEDAIRALPSVQTVRLTDKDAIEKAKGDFDALSEEGQKLVASDMQTKLANVVAQLQTIIEAQAKEGTPVTEALIPDAALRAIVLNDVDLDRNEKLSADEIAGTSKLNLAGGWRDSATAPLQKVSNLKGIELFENLVELDASNNAIATADLSAFADLQKANLANNKLASLDVSKNAELQSLDVSGNELTTLALGDLDYLTSLDVSNNKLVALSLGSAEPDTFNATGQKRSATYTGTSFDIATLDNSFAAAKAKNLKGATLSGTKLGGIASGTVTYDYDCGSGNLMSVTLSLAKDTAAEAAAAKAAQEKAAKEAAQKAAAAKAAAAKAAQEKAAAEKAAKEKAAKDAAAKKAAAEKVAKEKAAKDAAAKKAAAEKAAKKRATPGKPKLTAKTKSSKKGRVTVAWKKVAKAKGYQVKVGKKSYKVKSAKTLSKTVKAKAGAKVKVKVRAFAKYKGKVLYGPWSKAKTVKVKKG